MSDILKTGELVRSKVEPVGLFSLRCHPLKFSLREARTRQYSALNEDFQMDDIFDRSPIKNPSHCPVPFPYIPMLFSEMQLLESYSTYQ
jgi:hypothetical protein